MAPGPVPPRPPEKMSDLLALALKDFAEVEADWYTYQVDMGTWVSHYDSPQCHVCFAGAVISRTMLRAWDGKPFVGDIDPIEIEDVEWAHALFALDSLRRGDIAIAYAWSPNAIPDGIAARWPIASYETDPIFWREQMEALRAALAAAGD